MTKSQKIKLGVFTCLLSLLIGWLISIYEIVSNPTAIALLFAMIFLILINSFVIKEKKTKTWIWFSIVLLFFIMFHYSSGSKNDSENQEAIARIEPENDTLTLTEKSDKKAEDILTEIKVKRALLQEQELLSREKSNSKNQGRRVEILPPGQKPGKKIQKKNATKSIMDDWGYKTTQINCPRKKK